MSQLNPYDKSFDEFSKNTPKPFLARIGKQNYPFHILLFVITFFTTTLAGTFWIGKPSSFEDINLLKQNFLNGLPFSISLLLFLSVHEFGHFFACMAHTVRATLPFYIPMPPITFILNIGTLGALIRIKERIPSSKSLFDIGVSGPIAGFIIALGLLVYGFTHLPTYDYIYAIHPEYLELGYIPEPTPGTLVTGKNLLYLILEELFPSPYLPPMHEMYHYPFLFAGWLGTFVTALNLLPVGQLDGGHVIHAMFGGAIHRKIAKTFLWGIVALGLPTFLEWLIALLSLIIGFEFEGLPYPTWVRLISWPSWILWAFILVKVIKIEHPPVLNEHPLDTNRQGIGWVSILIFILSFTPVPFIIV